MPNNTVAPPSWQSLIQAGGNFNPNTVAANMANGQFNPLIQQLIQQQGNNATLTAGSDANVQGAYNPMIQAAQAGVDNAGQAQNTQGQMLQAIAEHLGGGNGQAAAAQNWAGFTQNQGNQAKTYATEGMTKAQKYVADQQQRRQAELAKQATDISNQLGTARGERRKAYNENLISLLNFKNQQRSGAIGDAGQIESQRIAAGMYPGQLTAQQIANQGALQNQSLQAQQAELGMAMNRQQLATLKSQTDSSATQNYMKVAPADRVSLMNNLMGQFVESYTNQETGVATTRVKSGANLDNVANSVYNQLNTLYGKTSKAGKANMKRAVHSWVSSWFAKGGQLPADILANIQSGNSMYNSPNLMGGWDNQIGSF
jgi:hypothetical protein